MAAPQVATLQRSPPRRILLVDDNVDSANALGMLLEQEGREVDLSHTAQRALQTGQSLRPDVVLLDIGLPEMDGYEVARRIRALPGLERIRLVALTGYGQANDKRQAQEAGFDDYLIKPVDFSFLQQTLAAAPFQKDTDGGVRLSFGKAVQPIGHEVGH